MLEGDFRLDRQRSNVTVYRRLGQPAFVTSTRDRPHLLLSSRASDSTQSVFRWCSQEVQDLVELIYIVSSFEDGSATQQFSEDTSYRPHVDCDDVGSRQY